MKDNQCKVCPKIGDVYMMEFYGLGSAQSGVRPGVIVQNNIGNHNSPNVVAVPLTSVIKNLNQPTHVLIKAENSGLLCDSMVLCECPMSIPKSNIGMFLCSLSNRYMKNIARAFLIEHPMLGYLSHQEIIDVQKESHSLIAG